VPEITILSKTPSVYVGVDRKLVETTFVVYKDKEGRVGTIVVPKAKPSDSEILDAVKKRGAGPGGPP